jgi:hypothetical protein
MPEQVPLAGEAAIALQAVQSVLCCLLRATEIFAGHTPPTFLLHDSNADYVFLLPRKSAAAVYACASPTLPSMCFFRGRQADMRPYRLRVE